MWHRGVCEGGLGHILLTCFFTTAGAQWSPISDLSLLPPQASGASFGPKAHGYCSPLMPPGAHKLQEFSLLPVLWLPSFPPWPGILTHTFGIVPSSNLTGSCGPLARCTAPHAGLEYGSRHDVTRIGIGAVGVRESVWKPEYGSIYMSKERTGMSSCVLQPSAARDSL